MTRRAVTPSEVPADERTSTVPVPKALLPYVLAAVLAAAASGGGSWLAVSNADPVPEAQAAGDHATLGELTKAVHGLELVLESDRGERREAQARLEGRLDALEGSCRAGAGQ